MADPVYVKNFRDSYVDKAQPTRNFSNLSRFRLAAAGSNTDKYGFFYHSLPFAKGATVTTGLFQVWNAGAVSGTVTLTAELIASSWAVGKVNWNNKPAVRAGLSVSITKSNAAANTLWELNIKPLLDYIATGGAWYGIRLTVTGAANKVFHSTQSPAVDQRPQVLITWSFPPNAPTQLAPAGGRYVSVPKPLLTYLFSDPGGDITLAAQNIQISTTSSFTSPLNDFGWTNTTVAQFDLNTAAGFTAMTEGQQLWWRARVRDGSGLESSWSEPAQFGYSAQNVLGLSNTFGTKVVSTNLAFNPADVSTGYAGEAIARWSWVETAGTDGGPIPGLATYSRFTVPAAGETNVTNRGIDGYWNSDIAPGTTGDPVKRSVTAGLTYPVSRWVRSSVATTFTMSVAFHNGAGAQVGTRVTGTPVQVLAGVWTRVSAIATAPAGATYMGYQLVNSVATTFPTGSTMDFAGLLIENSSVVGDFYTGSTVDSDNIVGPYIYAWTGTVNNSTTTKTVYYVEDTSPPIAWTSTGPRTQTKYRVLIFDMTEPNKALFDSGVLSSTATNATTTSSMMQNTTHDHLLQVWVWDDRPRQANGGAPGPNLIQQAFRYSPGTSVTVPSNVVVTPELPWPWVLITFTRPTMPDSFKILRDGEVAAENIDPLEIFTGVVGGVSTFAYRDRLAAPRVSHTWTVVANQNNVDSQPSTGYSLTPRPSVTWMMNTDGSSPICLVKSASEPTPVVDAQSASSQEVHQPIGGGAPVLITQYMSGFEGHVEAVLADDIIPGLTARTMKSRFKAWKKQAGTSVLLYMVDEVIEVVPYNMSYRPRAKSGGQILYDVVFDFFEAD